MGAAGRSEDRAGWILEGSGETMQRRLAGTEVTGRKTGKSRKRAGKKQEESREKAGKEKGKSRERTGEQQL